MRSVVIIIMAVMAAIVYGILHDQLTARVCVEYFTVGHPPIFETDDPTLLGLGWGIVATWWVGLPLGAMLAAAARFGSRPRRSVRSLIRPLLLTMLTTGACALLAGVLGWTLAARGYKDDYVAAIERFLALPATGLIPAAPYIYAYYVDFADVELQSCPLIAQPDGVWQAIRFTGEPSVHRREDGDKAVCISLEFDCDWEIEHGLQIVLCGGDTVCRVGPYDGTSYIIMPREGG